MGLVIRVVMMIGMVACLTSVARAVPGISTFSSSPLPTACIVPIGQDNLIAATNRNLFECGRRYRIQCTGSTNQGVPSPCRGNVVTVTIVDLCPGCAPNQFDLSQEAFAMIADPAAGTINIDYTRV